MENHGVRLVEIYDFNESDPVILVEPFQQVIDHLAL